MRIAFSPLLPFFSFLCSLANRRALMTKTKTFFVNFDIYVCHIVLFFLFQHYVNTNNQPCLLWVSLMNSLLTAFLFISVFLWTSGRLWSVAVSGLEPFLVALMTDLNNKDILMLQATGNGAHFWPLTHGVAQGLVLECVYLCLCLAENGLAGWYVYMHHYH